MDELFHFLVVGYLSRFSSAIYLYRTRTCKWYDQRFLEIQWTERGFAIVEFVWLGNQYDDRISCRSRNCGCVSERYRQFRSGKSTWGLYCYGQPWWLPGNRWLQEVRVCPSLRRSQEMGELVVIQDIGICLWWLLYCNNGKEDGQERDRRWILQTCSELPECL